MPCSAYFLSFRVPFTKGCFCTRAPLGEDLGSLTSSIFDAGFPSFDAPLSGIETSRWIYVYKCIFNVLWDSLFRELSLRVCFHWENIENRLFDEANKQIWNVKFSLMIVFIKVSLNILCIFVNLYYVKFCINDYVKIFLKICLFLNLTIQLSFNFN